MRGERPLAEAATDLVRAIAAGTGKTAEPDSNRRRVRPAPTIAAEYAGTATANRGDGDLTCRFVSAPAGPAR